MPRTSKSKSRPDRSTANLGFEAKLWLVADKRRNKIDVAEYKHLVLGLILLKYISDPFEEHRAKLFAGKGDYEGANPENPDEYRTENIFWVPQEARWAHLQAAAKQPTIGKLMNDAVVAIEHDNLRLKDVLSKDYAPPRPRQTASWRVDRPHRHNPLVATGEGEKIIQGQEGLRFMQSSVMRWQIMFLCQGTGQPLINLIYYPFE